MTCFVIHLSGVNRLCGFKVCILTTEIWHDMTDFLWKQGSQSWQYHPAPEILWVFNFPSGAIFLFFCECCWVFFCSLDVFWKKSMLLLKEIARFHVSQHINRGGNRVVAQQLKRQTVCSLAGWVPYRIEANVCMGEFWNMDPPESSGKNRQGLCEFEIIMYIYECTYQCRILLTPTGIDIWYIYIFIYTHDTCSVPIRFFPLSSKLSDVGRGLLPPQV